MIQDGLADMRRQAIAYLGALLMAALLAACGGGDRAIVGTFAGQWSGHTRRLHIARNGEGREIVDDGCCSRVVTVRFRLLRVRGTPEEAEATTKITFARVDKDVFAALHRRPPHAGQIGTLRLRRGVLTDESTKVTFCAEDVDKCGL